jgi:competence ComEA-like helix-hairpin-helix protein
MIGNIGMRGKTLAWVLVAAFAIGAGIQIANHLRAGAVTYPITVVKNDSEFKAIQQQADSILLERAAKENAPLDINIATAVDFERLDGIGPVLASRIIAFRDRHGRFANVDELDSVSGIGPKRLAAIRDFCVVNPAP